MNCSIFPNLNYTQRTLSSGLRVAFATAASAASTAVPPASNKWNCHPRARALLRLGDLLFTPRHTPSTLSPPQTQSQPLPSAEKNHLPPGNKWNCHPRGRAFCGVGDLLSTPSHYSDALSSRRKPTYDYHQCQKNCPAPLDKVSSCGI